MHSQKLEKLKHLFGLLAFLELSNEDKGEVAKTISQDLEADKLYWIEVVLSSLIATLGLLQNSVAVIIGAMLIAPLLRPIQAMAMGIATGQSRLFLKALNLLVASIVLAIFISAITTKLIPIRYETSEMLARTNPNILDLFIAFFSGTIAILSLGFKRLSESIAGVAMAASLLPPLAVSGIELSFMHLDTSWGSFFLFLTNLVAILFVGAIIFFLYGYQPHQSRHFKSMFRKYSILILTLVIISVPLFSSLFKISDEIALEQKANQAIHDILEKIDPDIKISNVKLVKLNNIDASFKTTFKIPEGKSFLANSQFEIQEYLTGILEKNIDLEIEILRTANIVTENTTDTFTQKLALSFRELFHKNFPDANIFQQDIIPQKSGEFIVKTAFSINPGIQINIDSLLPFETLIAEKYPQEIFQFLWIPIATQQLEPKTVADLSPEEIFQSELESLWEIFFQESLEKDGFEVQNFTLSWSKKIDKENTEKELNNQKEEIKKLSQKDIETLSVSFDIWGKNTIYSYNTNQAIKQFIAEQFPEITVEKQVRLFRYENL